MTLGDRRLLPGREGRPRHRRGVSGHHRRGSGSTSPVTAGGDPDRGFTLGLTLFRDYSAVGVQPVEAAIRTGAPSLSAFHAQTSSEATSTSGSPQIT